MDASPNDRIREIIKAIKSLKVGIFELNPFAVKQYMISKHNKVWNTEPERFFNSYQILRGLGLIQNVTLPFTWEGQRLSFQCDFVTPNHEIDFEIDGAKYHSSVRQQQKDKWKDGIKNGGGLKVIHIPAEICRKKWWPYLDAQIHRAESKPIGGYYIAA